MNRDTISHIMLFIPFFEVLPLAHISKLWLEAFEQYKQMDKVLIFPNTRSSPPFYVRFYLRDTRFSAIYSIKRWECIEYYFKSLKSADFRIETINTIALYEQGKLKFIRHRSRTNILYYLRILKYYLRNPYNKLPEEIHFALGIKYLPARRIYYKLLAKYGLYLMLNSDHRIYRMIYITTHPEKYNSPYLDLKNNILYDYEESVRQIDPNHLYYLRFSKIKYLE